MGDNVAQKLDNAIKSINKGADKKEEMRWMMAPFADWDRFLSAAPLSIALLGHLILISTETDFTLQNKNESIHFKFLKYPDSFRACLVQVTNSGWGAFNTAHTCMDQIRLHSGNVDKHVRTAVKFLTSGSAQEVELMVPDALRSIENIADNCVVLATSVENEFVKVMDMVAEIEACTRAKGQHEQGLRDTEISIQVAEQHKKAVELEKKQAEEKKNLMMKQMKEAQNDYKEAMDSMPTTGSLLGLAVADMFIGITRIGNILADLAKLNLDQIDHETIKKTLVRGINALALLREQWEKLVRFFQMLSNLVHCCLHTSLKTFVQTSHNQERITGTGGSMSDTIRDVIFEQAFQANQIAYVVNSISSVYVEVSQKYLMDRITCLGNLIALDPVKDKREIMLKREELNQGCTEAQDAIVKIALEKKNEMTKALDERIGRIENEVEALMPPIPATERKAMGKAMTAVEIGDLV